MDDDEMTNNDPDVHREEEEEEESRVVSREQALRFNTRWTNYDRVIVGIELDRLADRTHSLLQPKSNPYIRVVDKQGRTLMYIGAGWLWWHQEIIDELLEMPEGLVADGKGWLLPLSTRQESGPRLSRAEINPPEICPKCASYALSVSGLCPSCDE